MKFHEIHFNFTSLIIVINKSRHQIRAWLESDFSSWFTFLFGHHLLPYYVMQQTAAPIAGHGRHSLCCAFVGQAIEKYASPGHLCAR